MRVCGLKPIYIEVIDGRYVAPHAGVWIETVVDIKTL